MEAGVSTFWTDARREIVSKTLFDVFKVELAAAFATKFFAEFDPLIKLLLTSVILATAVVAVVVFPAKTGDA